MKKIERMAIWLCNKFTRSELEIIVAYLLDVLANRNPEVKPRDDFKEKHPNYCNFSIDPNPPITKLPVQPQSTKNWTTILKELFQKTGNNLKPIIRINSNNTAPKDIKCPRCNAPSEYLFYNNGKQRSQIRCKVCNNLFNVNRNKHIPKSLLFCPYCQRPLFKWKQKHTHTIYKCDNDKCPLYLNNLKKLNPAEKELRKSKPSQFKLRYQYRVYNFKEQELCISEPHQSIVNLSKIHNHPNVVGLILTFYISFANSARKTALILNKVFNIPVSYQTVLNYAEAASFYCHKFNLHYKGSVNSLIAGDETYIKILGKWAFTFFFVAIKSLKIIAYHVANDRSVLPAVISLKEAIRTARPKQRITAVTDKNPSYAAAIHFVNSTKKGRPLTHRNVVGLQNLDEESETFRPFKQIIERLIRTYKFHIRPACGFASNNGAIALTALVVTHYNFLRPHYTLKGNTPIHLDELQRIPTIQDQWCKIIDMAMALCNPN